MFWEVQNLLKTLFIFIMIRMRSHLTAATPYQATLGITGLAQPRFSHFIGRRLNSRSYVWKI